MDVQGQSFLIFNISDEEESGIVEPNVMLLCEDSPQRNKKNKKVWKWKGFVNDPVKNAEGLWRFKFKIVLGLCWFFKKISS